MASLRDPEGGHHGGPELYERIAVCLAQGIEDRVWGQGEKLPPSALIARRFRTRTDTARAAVRVLIEQGYAERQPGGAAFCRGPKIGF